MKSKGTRRVFAVFMAVMLVMAQGTGTVFAESGDSPVCNHIHNEICSYEEGVPCDHEHVADCGGLSVGQSVMETTLPYGMTPLYLKS